VKGLCVVAWGNSRYVIDCSPSFLLSLATKIAEAESASYIDVYRRILRSLNAEYDKARIAVEDILSEKVENI